MVGDELTERTGVFAAGPRKFALLPCLGPVKERSWPMVRLHAQQPFVS